MAVIRAYASKGALQLPEYWGTLHVIAMFVQNEIAQAKHSNKNDNVILTECKALVLSLIHI